MASKASMATKRIRKEMADLAKEDLGNITLVPDESNIFHWKATLPGPVGSPYEGGAFEVDVRIPEQYPFAPPVLLFLTKVYHCNIAPSGAICLDLLKTAWSPALSLYKVILSLSSLLTDPNPADPLVPNIAQEYKKSRAKHDATAREWTKMYATPKNPPPVPKASVGSTSRLRPIHRPSPSAAPQQVAGTRRSHTETNGTSNPANGHRPTTSSMSVDDDSDVEVLDTSSVPNADAPAGRVTRPAKRNRRDEGGGDDVIVIDD